MARNIERVLRLVNAAARLVEVETSYNAGKGARGGTLAKRELKEAYEDYMRHHFREGAK